MTQNAICYSTATLPLYHHELFASAYKLHKHKFLLLCLTQFLTMGSKVSLSLQLHNNLSIQFLVYI